DIPVDDPQHTVVASEGLSIRAEAVEVDSDAADRRFAVVAQAVAVLINPVIARNHGACSAYYRRGQCQEAQEQERQGQQRRSGGAVHGGMSPLQAQWTIGGRVWASIVAKSASLAASNWNSIAKCSIHHHSRLALSANST